MTTVSANKDKVTRRWHLVDADGQILGRMCTQVASLLRGKHKTDYTPHVDTGDFVIVINAAKVKLTGKKDEKKQYWWHTGWQGHIKSRNAAELRETDPVRIIETAIKGMLPKGPLGMKMITKLKVYPGAEHPHVAQRPEILTIRKRGEN